jgi:DNA-binding LytR/AlgR family response regulator
MSERQQAMAGSPGRDAIFVAIFAFVGCAIAVVDAFSVTHDRAEAGRPVPFWEPLVWETTSVVVLTVLAPAIMALTRRFLPLAAPWARVIAAHLVGAVAYSVAHVTAMGVLRWAVYAAVGDFYSPLSPLGDFLYEFRKDLLVYFAVVAIYTVWLRLTPAKPPEGPDNAIEVRDGARRHFLPLAEIAWIEAAGNYVELHRGATPILHRAPLSQMERRLQGAGFVRIHRSRLVRRAAIVQVESKPSGDYVVRLADGRELAGSRRYRKPLLDT